MKSFFLYDQKLKTKSWISWERKELFFIIFKGLLVTEKKKIGRWEPGFNSEKMELSTMQFAKSWFLSLQVYITWSCVVGRIDPPSPLAFPKQHKNRKLAP